MMAIIDIGAMGLLAAERGEAPEDAEQSWRELSDAMRERYRNDMRNAVRSLNLHGYLVKHASDVLAAQQE